MGDKDRHFDQTKLEHRCPQFRIVPGIGIALVPKWIFGWVKPNRKQRAKARRGQR